MAQEYIALTLDVSRESVDVKLVVESVGAVDVEVRLAEISQAKQAAAVLETQAKADTVALAQMLAAEHVPVRDIGSMLNVSFQRAHQLLHDAPQKRRAS